jgi:hypothetical protein
VPGDVVTYMICSLQCRALGALEGNAHAGRQTCLQETREACRKHELLAGNTNPTKKEAFFISSMIKQHHLD